MTQKTLAYLSFSLVCLALILAFFLGRDWDKSPYARLMVAAMGVGAIGLMVSLHWGRPRREMLLSFLWVFYVVAATQCVFQISGLISNGEFEKSPRGYLWYAATIVVWIIIPLVRFVWVAPRKDTFQEVVNWVLVVGIVSPTVLAQLVPGGPWWLVLSAVCFALIVWFVCRDIRRQRARRRASQP